MDTIRELGVNPNAPSSESLPILTSLSIPQLLFIRDDLFTENANQGLTCDGDVLVSRKDSRKKPLNSKLAEDIICLLFCIKNESVVPRTMLKNGKRRKDYLDASRREKLTLSQVPTPTQRHRSHDSDSATSGSTANVTSTLSESVRASVLMKDINLLKKDLDDLKRNVSLLFRQKPSPPVPSTCHICIIFPHRNPSLESDNISELIGCPALSVVRINIKTLKVKIYKECLHKALLSSNSNSHLVKIWRSKSSGPPPTLHSHSTQSRVDRPSTISIASWNCRGLHNAIPYIRTIIQSQIHQLEAQTYLENDYVLDSTIVVEEIEAALAHLKKSSSGGPDHLSPHHLSLSGPLFKNWICKIFNTILTLEAIPASFKAGIIIPLYKGKGKDPLSTDSYRGITLTSVLAKSFEFVLLDRILPTISDLNIPHLTQTAYQKGVSCSEAIFACQEAIAKLTREGDRVYSCFYDLASAFDSVEYPVLLSHLKSAGVTGKAWRLIKQWYTNPTSSVRVCGSVSSQFHIQRGVRQGSVLSPVLFLLVMDPILLELQSRSNGLNINGLFLGALSHADDIHTLSTNLTDCRAQISSVSSFATQRGLMLSTEKCEAIISPSVPANKSYIQADAIKIPISHSARCLGAWWTPNLSSSKWITVNINKARGAFFSRGSGTFHGTLNPLSSRSIIECCVLPTLLYGAESWILNTTLLIKLESFQAEIGKRILRLPKFVANNTVRMALQWPSVRTRVLCIKLGFLLKVLKNENSLSARVFRSLAVSDVEALHLIRQCRFLESSLNTNFTSRILSSHQEFSFSQLKKEIIEVDFSLLLSEASNHSSQRYVQAVAASPISSWPKVWDSALEKGAFGTSCSLALLRLLSLHTYSDNKCPVPNCSYVVGEDSLCSHFLADHTTLSITAEQCVYFLENCSEEIYSYGKTLNQIFRNIWN